jgi:nicotinamidase/pyrazinamidase
MRVRVLTDLVAGVAQASSAAALEELRGAGIETVPASPGAHPTPGCRP